MNALEVTKLRLLSHSKNMLDAAQKSEWKRFSELENGWMALLNSSTKTYGEALNQVGVELVKDNELIKECIEREQKALLKKLGDDSKNISSIKSYLK